MDINVIRQYQHYGDLGYVTPLVCATHGFLSLIPRLSLDGMELICPLEDTRRLLGLADYRQLELKLAMAKALARQKGL